jgi:hypothetical protein
VSDNAKTFRAAEERLNAFSLQQRDVQQFLTTRRIEWDFIPEKAPWMGGFYERLVVSVKGALKKTQGRASLQYEEFVTVMTEIEAVINSRPISFVASDTREETITPSHFLILQRHTEEPTNPTNGDQLLPLPQQLRRAQVRVNNFWNCWVRDYLFALRERAGKQRRCGNRTIAVGDVVLIEESNLPRLKWKLGMVESLHRGRDGQSRSGLVRLAKSADARRRGTEFIRRPVQLLIPLETSV